MCPLSFLTVSVISGLIFEEIYELFAGTNKTVRKIGVSVFRCPG